MKAYRQAFESVPTGESKVPFIAVHLKDLFFANEVVKSLTADTINVSWVMGAEGDEAQITIISSSLLCRLMI